MCISFMTHHWPTTTASIGPDLTLEAPTKRFRFHVLPRLSLRLGCHGGSVPMGVCFPHRKTTFQWRNFNRFHCEAWMMVQNWCSYHGLVLDSVYKQLGMLCPFPCGKNKSEMGSPVWPSTNNPMVLWKNKTNGTYRPWFWPRRKNKEQI
jgi:hypothetical protein